MAAPSPQGGAGKGSVHPKLSDYQVGMLISKGAFGSVYKAVRKSDGRVMALKQVNLANKNRADRQEAIDEARVLAGLNHPHVTRHYDSFIDAEDRLNILMEYAAGGDLASMLKRSPGRPMPEDFVWKMLIQAVLGLNYLHSKRIIHRDIKALNIFFDSKGNVKIGDLGVARPLSEMSNFAESKVGTVFYLSPELCEDKPYNVKSDVWALGVVLYECMMGKYPFDAQNEGALIRKIIKGTFPPIQGQFSTALVGLATSCLTFRPEARPDTNQLLRNATLLAKAKALAIDMNPKSAAEDVPIYEQPQGMQPMMQQQQQPGPASPYGYQQPQAGGAYGSPYGGMSPGAGYGAPSDHPFAMAGAGPGMMQQQQQYGSPAPGGYGSPAPGQYGSPAPGSAMYRSPAGGPGMSPHQYPPHQQQPPRSPYIPQGNKNVDNPWDNLAGDINKIQISDTERARHNVDRVNQMKNNVHAGQRDNLKDLMYQGPQDSGPRQQRVKPEVLPAAGGRPASAHAGAPFALHYGGPTAGESVAQATMNEAWRAVYQPPTFGRRRCPELQITGPSMRGTSARGGGGGGGYVAAADDATTYVSTSYATSYYK